MYFTPTVVNSFRPRDYSGPVNLPLPPAATLLQNDSAATVVLLGTVHFSKQSVEDVSTVSELLTNLLSNLPRPPRKIGDGSSEFSFIVVVARRIQIWVSPPT